MKRKLLKGSSPPYRKSPPPVLLFPPPYDNEYVILHNNILCDISLSKLMSFIQNSSQTIRINDDNEYISDFTRPLSNIENIYNCIIQQKFNYSQLNTTILYHTEVYDTLFKISRYTDKRFIQFNISLNNNTYIFTNTVTTLLTSGYGTSVGIAFAFAIAGFITLIIIYYICCCIKIRCLFKSNQIYNK
jgi:hypothetical protein